MLVPSPEEQPAGNVTSAAYAVFTLKDPTTSANTKNKTKEKILLVIKI
jgi:hypothetical protein